MNFLSLPVFFLLLILASTLLVVLESPLKSLIYIPLCVYSAALIRKHHSRARKQ